MWKCKYNSEVYSANVSASKGIIEDTSVQFEVLSSSSPSGPGTMRNVQFICFSCWNPYGYHAEFLINNISIDSVTYFSGTSTCHHRDGKCNPKSCSCGPFENMFTRNYTVDISKRNFYSCAMIFVDMYSGGKFSKTSGIYMDQQGVSPMETATLIIKPRTKDDFKTTLSNNDNSTVNWTKYTTPRLQSTNSGSISVPIAVGLVVILTVTVSLLAVVVLHCRKNYWKNKSKVKKENEESLLLCTTERDQYEYSLSQTKNDTKDMRERLWFLVGYLCQRANSTVTAFIRSEFSIQYDRLVKETQIHTQNYSNHITELFDKILNYKAVNDNFINYGDDEEKYDYKIIDDVSLSKLFFSSYTSSYDTSDTSDIFFSFDSITELLDINVFILPQPFKEAITMVHKDWIDWVNDEYTMWTEERFQSLAENVYRIAEHCKYLSTEEIKMLKTKGHTLFDQEEFQGELGNVGKKLNHFLERVGRSRNEYVKNKIHCLMKDNRTYCEFMKTEERNLQKLMRLIMGIGMTVVQTYIKYHVMQKNEEFKSFLNKNKHRLFHAWHNKKRCCQCNTDHVELIERCSLTRDQYSLLYCIEAKPLMKCNSNNHHCICNISVHDDVTLKTVNFTIALCIMAVCTSIKSSDQKEKEMKASIIKGTEQVRDCQDKVLTLVRTKEVCSDFYNATWRKIETNLIGMSAFIDKTFGSEIEHEIRHLKTDDSKYDYTKLLEECEQDLLLSKNQLYEERFFDKLRALKGHRSEFESMKEKKEIMVFTDSLEGIDIKTEIFSDSKNVTSDVAIYDFLLEVDVPMEWNIDEILETLRRNVSSINKDYQLQIIETTLEEFSIIGNFPSSVFNHLEAEFKKFIGRIFKTCRIADYVKRDLGVLSILVHVSGNKQRSNNKFESSADIHNDDIECKLLDHSIVVLEHFATIRINTGKTVHFTSCSVWSDEEFLFLDSDSSSLIFYNFKQDTMSMCELPPTPFSMAVMDEEIIAVSFPKKEEIRILRISNNKIVSIEIEKMDGKCYTLAKRDNDTVLVSIDNVGIYSYNIKSKVKKGLGIDIPYFVPPSDEVYFNAGRLVHTCRAEGSLYCYDIGGNSIWTMTNILKHPTTVTSDSHGNVFATDFVSSSLYHISSDGRSYSVLLTRKINKRLMHPTAIYFCEKRKWLLIVNRDNGYAFCYQSRTVDHKQLK